VESGADCGARPKLCPRDLLVVLIQYNHDRHCTAQFTGRTAQPTASLTLPPRFRTISPLFTAAAKKGASCAVIATAGFWTSDAIPTVG
jgi:hypothetical protein